MRSQLTKYIEVDNIIFEVRLNFDLINLNGCLILNVFLVTDIDEDKYLKKLMLQQMILLSLVLDLL
jgi:hypothetical protein